MFCVLSTAAVLITAQPVRLPAPEMRPGLEFVYSGTYRLIRDRPGDEKGTEYRLENRLFVLSADDDGADLAVLTRAQPIDAETPTSGLAVTLALARFTADGGVRLYPTDRPWPMPAAMAVGPLPPLPTTGPPSTLNGALFPISEEAWESGSDAALRGTMTREIGNTSKSPDWDRPQEGRVAWRVTDRVWISPLSGYAIRSRREIELRDPADEFPWNRVELDSNFARRVMHPGPMARRMKSGILAVRGFQLEFDRLAGSAGRADGADLANLRGRVERHLARSGGSAYDAVLATMLGKIDALQRGGLAPRDDSR